MMMSRNQGQVVAAVVHALRPDWDPAGIMAALQRAARLGDAFEVTLAAVAAAQEPTNRTPAVIALEGAHWSRARTSPPTPTPGPGARARCTVYGHEHYLAHNCAGCKTDRLTRPVDDEPPARDLDPRELAAGAREEF